MPGGGLRAQLRACAAAFTFLTRVPAHRAVAHDAGDLWRAATYFPFVGLVVGLLGGLAYTAAALVWPPAIAVVLSVALTVWITGAFHEDALADACDGFGGGWDAEQILAIMKDSRSGAYAIVGVLLMMATKFLALTHIAVLGAADDVSAFSSAIAVTRALVVGHVLGRWSSIPLMWRLPYVRTVEDTARPGTGTPFAGHVTFHQLAMATAFMVVVVVAATGWRALPAVVAAITITWVAGRYFRTRLGGITGDALGAANQIVELSVYLVLAAHGR